METPSFRYESYEYHHDSHPINLDVAYYPSSTEERIPRETLVLYHGGGLFSGSRRGRFPPLPVKFLLEAGWVIIVPDYRLLPEASIKDMIEDTRHLEEWIMAHAETFALDIDNVCVGGSSAGCIVSILTFSAWKRIQPRAYFGLWAMLDTTSEWYNTAKGEDISLGGVPASSLQRQNFERYLQPGNPKISDDRGAISDPTSRASFFLWMLKEGKIGPLINSSLKDATGSENVLDLVTPSFPPAVLIHGVEDTVAPISDSRVLASKLSKLSVKAILIEVEGADHGIHPQDRWQKEFEEGVAELKALVMKRAA